MLPFQCSSSLNILFRLLILLKFHSARVCFRFTDSSRHTLERIVINKFVGAANIVANVKRLEQRQHFDVLNGKMAHRDYGERDRKMEMEMSITSCTPEILSAFFVCFVYRSCCKYNIVEHTMVNQFWRWCCWCNNNQWVRIWWMESMAGHLQLLRALHLPLKFRYSYIFNGRVFSVNAPHSLDTEPEFRTLYLVWVCDNDIHSCCLSPPECGNSTNLFNAFFSRSARLYTFFLRFYSINQCRILIVERQTLHSRFVVCLTIWKLFIQTMEVHRWECAKYPLQYFNKYHFIQVSTWNWTKLRSSISIKFIWNIVNSLQSSPVNMKLIRDYNVGFNIDANTGYRIGHYSTSGITKF